MRLEAILLALGALVSRGQLQTDGEWSIHTVLYTSQ